MKDHDKVNNAALFILLAVSVILLCWWIRPFLFPSRHITANIWVHNQQYMSIDLIHEPNGTISLLENTGVAIILEIKDHQIRFSHSDCPDQICVHMGFLKNDTDSAICMPNQTAIFIRSE